MIDFNWWDLTHGPIVPLPEGYGLIDHRLRPETIQAIKDHPYGAVDPKMVLFRAEPITESSPEEKLVKFREFL